MSDDSNKPKWNSEWRKGDDMPSADPDDFQREIEAQERRDKQEQRDYQLSRPDKTASGDDDPTKKLTRVVVREKTHKSLEIEANRAGVFINDYAGRVLDIVMEEWTDVTDDEPNAARFVYWKMSEMEVLSKRYDIIRRAAAIHQKCQTSETAEILYDLCERMGVDPKRAESEAANDPYIGIVAASENDLTSKRSQCRQFVMDITRNRDEVPAKEVLMVGAERGFSATMMREEASRLGLVTYKKGAHFYWRRSPMAKLASSLTT